ncbi:anthrone oxygenase family protein [Streptomyces sp. KL118A]|uniref:anthrone oxygenase family protein n=1 Tax=Streptomyces sp. KL118A TaxID=3045153 RepID=UPI00278C4104|nr:anthrone oxygenase family protein [Streptomyces sp. KL118A]
MKHSPLATAARFAGLIFLGIFAGFLVAVLVLETSLRDYDGRVYAQVRQVELDSLDTLASATLIPAILATVLLIVAVRRSRGPALWLPVAALALMLVVLVVTLTINLPINGDQNDWDVTAPPSDWAEVRDEWQSAHVVRVVAAVGAFALLLVAAVRRPVAAAAPPRPADPVSAGRR